MSSLEISLKIISKEDGIRDIDLFKTISITKKVDRKNGKETFYSFSSCKSINDHCFSVTEEVKNLSDFYIFISDINRNSIVESWISIKDRRENSYSLVLDRDFIKIVSDSNLQVECLY